MLKCLRLRNFRNFAEESFQFEPSANVFLGANGTGKSSALEALSLFSTLRSFRTSRMEELRRNGTQFFDIELDADFGKGWNSTLRIFEGSERKLFRDGEPVRKMSEFAGSFQTVVFLPDDLEILCGSPGRRRSFLDRFLCMTDRSYMNSLRRYLQALMRYNAVLKSGEPSFAPGAAFGNVMAEEAAVLLPKRRMAVQMFSEKIGFLLAKLRPSMKKVFITYRSDSGIEDRQFYLKKLEASFSNDRMRGSASVGPHHDDLEFNANGSVLRFYGSRGQCRIAALALKMAEFEAVGETLGKEPVVIADDAMADLDAPSKLAFLEKIAPAEQVFHAYTELPGDDHFKNANIIRLT